jgi:hypothetical protein
VHGEHSGQSPPPCHLSAAISPALRSIDSVLTSSWRCCRGCSRPCSRSDHYLLADNGATVAAGTTDPTTRPPTPIRYRAPEATHPPAHDQAAPDSCRCNTT